MTAAFAQQRLAVLPGAWVRGIRLTINAVEGDGAPAWTCGVVQTDGREPETSSVRVLKGNSALDAWMARAWADLQMLTTDNFAQGGSLMRGFPWYVAPFGRDSIITALQHLPFDPGLARGTLKFMADLPRVEEKIHSPTRARGRSCMSTGAARWPTAREIVFVPYYRISGTPRRSSSCWPPSTYAGRTTASSSARSGRPSTRRLGGWTDRTTCPTSPAPPGVSSTRVGRIPTTRSCTQTGRTPRARSRSPRSKGTSMPALRAVAEIEEAEERPDRARALRASAGRLSEQFMRDYWMGSEKFCALALDGDGVPCRVISSNPAHCLWTGLIPAEPAAHIARRLMAGSSSRAGACAPWGFMSDATIR